MKKQNFDLNWEYTEVSGFAAMFNPNAWQAVPNNTTHNGVFTFQVDGAQKYTTVTLDNDTQVGDYVQ